MGTMLLEKKKSCDLGHSGLDGETPRYRSRIQLRYGPDFKRPFCHPNCHPIIRDWVTIHRTGRDNQIEKPNQINLGWDQPGPVGTSAALYKPAALPA